MRKGSWTRASGKQQPARGWRGARREVGHRRKGYLGRSVCFLGEVRSSLDREEGARTGKTAAKPMTWGGQHGSEHEGPGSGWRARGRGTTWGWAWGLDPTRAVGEQKESDKVRGERVRDTRGSACTNWLGGRGELGGWAWAGNMERGPMAVWRGRGLLEMRTEETGVDPRKRGCDPNKGKVQGLEAKVGRNRREEIHN